MSEKGKQLRAPRPRGTPSYPYPRYSGGEGWVRGGVASSLRRVVAILLPFFAISCGPKHKQRVPAQRGASTVSVGGDFREPFATSDPLPRRLI